MQIGEKRCSFITCIMQLLHKASGDDAKLRDAFPFYAAATGEDKPVNPQFRLIDKMAGLMVPGIADRYWTLKIQVYVLVMKV